MQTDLECLLFLENNSFSILEIKHKSQTKWLRIDSINMKVDQLTEQSSDSSQDVEERFFDLGYLKFNRLTGIFIEKYNSAQHSLLVKTGTEVPLSHLIAVDEFLHGRLQLCSENQLSENFTKHFLLAVVKHP